MELQIQDLVNSIKRDGIDQAEKESAEIIAKAKLEAEAILDNVNKEASKILEDANKEVAVLKQSAFAAINQSARDLSLSLQESIKKQFERLLGENVTKALSSTELVKLIVEVVKISLIDSKDAVVGLGAKDAKKLADSLKGELTQQLKDGLVIKPVEGLDFGFRLSSKKDGSYFDFSSDEITNLLKPFLSSAINDILSSEKSN
ncbi:MAG: V-type ATP synthase subunit E [Sphaerochaetaceae bacterium]